MIRNDGRWSGFAFAAGRDPARRLDPCDARRRNRGRRVRRIACLVALTAQIASAQIVFDAQFSDGSDGFVYVDDAFLATHAPDYGQGALVSERAGASGVLAITLGNRDSLTVTGMSGGWSRAFVLDRPIRDLRILFRCQLIQTSGYEPDEFSQVMVMLDGTLLTSSGIDFVARIEGDGDGGAERATGWLVFSLSEASASKGRHVLTIGGYSNKKTVDNESTQILIDDVRVTGIPDEVQ